MKRIYAPDNIADPPISIREIYDLGSETEGAIRNVVGKGKGIRYKLTLVAVGVSVLAALGVSQERLSGKEAIMASMFGAGVAGAGELVNRRNTSNRVHAIVENHVGRLGLAEATCDDPDIKVHGATNVPFFVGGALVGAAATSMDAGANTFTVSVFAACAGLAYRGAEEVDRRLCAGAKTQIGELGKIAQERIPGNEL